MRASTRSPSTRSAARSCFFLRRNRAHGSPRADAAGLCSAFQRRPRAVGHHLAFALGIGGCAGAARAAVRAARLRRRAHPLSGAPRARRRHAGLSLVSHRGSRAGLVPGPLPPRPLGAFELLFTPSAILIGYMVIALPILMVFTVAAVQGADSRIYETARCLGARPLRAMGTTLWEVRFAVMAGFVNAFGRVVSEVGCALLVGGNIAGLTRNIPTAIALETSKGEFAYGIALGFVLMVIAVGINVALAWLQGEGGLE